MKKLLKRFSLIIVFLPLPLAAAEELGCLFFTPEQRTQLDYSYQRAMSPENADSGVILNGIVQKHGGKRTAWINGVAKEAGQSDERSPESMPVIVPGASKPIKIKVGQKIEVTPSSPSQ